MLECGALIMQRIGSGGIGRNRRNHVLNELKHARLTTVHGEKMNSESSRFTVIGYSWGLGLFSS